MLEYTIPAFNTDGIIVNTERSSICV